MPSASTRPRSRARRRWRSSDQPRPPRFLPARIYTVRRRSLGQIRTRRRSAPIPSSGAIRRTRMSDKAVDYYEVLQISPNAEPDTVHRVYRLLAQRLHPDNHETGNASLFRQVTEAYQVVSDPEQRVRYDVIHAQQRQERWRLVSSNDRAENDF